MGCAIKTIACIQTALYIIQHWLEKEYYLSGLDRPSGIPGKFFFLGPAGPKISRPGRKLPSNGP